jgi:hypothetical protein
MQYIWVLNLLPGRNNSNAVNAILKEMMVFLWMGLGGKPERVELLTLHPTSLKTLKTESAGILFAQKVESYMTKPIEYIDTLVTINMPFRNKSTKVILPIQVTKPNETGTQTVSSLRERKENEASYSLCTEELIPPKVNGSGQSAKIEAVTAPTILGPVYSNGSQLLPNFKSPEIKTCLINSEITSSRLLVCITGIQKQILSLSPAMVQDLLFSL